MEFCMQKLPFLAGDPQLEQGSEVLVLLQADKSRKP